MQKREYVLISSCNIIRYACPYLLKEGAAKIRTAPTISSAGYTSLKRRSTLSLKVVASASEEPAYLTPTQFTVKGLNHRVEGTGSGADFSTTCDDFPEETIRFSGEEVWTVMYRPSHMYWSLSSVREPS